MIKLLRLAFVALALAAGAAAAAGVSDMTLDIDNFTFSPATIEVKAGTRLVWINRDDIPHTVTSAEDPAHVRSQPLDNGDRYARVFATRGIFHYFCSLHPRMQGIVVVK